jgi:predicted hotdog family 3-hydroxylacyl-ACP dehydratase
VSALPAIAELLPHRPPMLLVDELLECSPGRARAAVRLRADSPFMEAGRVRALVAIEYMGQTAAACAGLLARTSGGAPSVGLLLGTRELSLEVEHFHAGDTLTVEAERVAADERISSFRCQVRRGDALVAAAVLNVLLLAPGAEAP